MKNGKIRSHFHKKIVLEKKIRIFVTIIVFTQVIHMELERNYKAPKSQEDLAKLSQIRQTNKDWAICRETKRIIRKYRTSDFEPMCYFPNH